MLLIFAYLYAHKRCVMLVDEPDAHLESLRQRQVFVLLRAIAAANRSQVVMVTHSEVIPDAALDSNLTLLLEGKADNLAKKTDLRESLKLFGTAHYVRARQRGYVLYVEGDTDVENLRRWRTASGAARRTCGLRLPTFSSSRTCTASIHRERDRASRRWFRHRAEGPLQRSPQSFLPVSRLAILDNDGRNRQDFSGAGLRIIHWKRYELENYFITPELDGEGSDFRVWAQSPPEAKRLITPAPWSAFDYEPG